MANEGSSQRLVAKPSPDGIDRVRVLAPALFTLEEAANALARYYLAETQPRRFGWTTARDALRDAAGKGITGRDAKGLPSSSVTYFRDKLIDLEIFTDPELPHA